MKGRLFCLHLTHPVHARQPLSRITGNRRSSMRKHEQLLAAAIAALMAVGPAGLYASDTAVGPDFAIDRENAPVLEKNYSPFVGDDYPDRVFWGETHLHTSYS